ncbi:serine hydrolase domain-containing protein [Sphingorhabdus sp. EL138]|uniref:serine hydrolase domain-containing protein n=1 Tax=Sphingorhabdus sp. EL138 TaxID=2073156 RepID=UPI0025D71735|nr:serine hydrolase domain-containing protein [Sphingorhabdus sp. EL138]
MRRILLTLIAASVLGLTGIYTMRAAPENNQVAVILRKFTKPHTNLPDQPDEWRGRIHYAQLDQQFAAMAQRSEMAGLAIAIVEDGELRFVRTYGVIDRDTNAPVTLNTVFRWASVSKTVAGTLAATLANEGLVDLDSPVARYDTTLRLPEGAETRVSFQQLLSQQTGLTKNAFDERLEDGQDPRVLRTSLASAPLQCPPGSCHTYQNIAFDAATEILEQVAQRSYPDAVSERFFLPLGMNSANFGMAGLTNAKDWARPHNGRMVRTVKETYWRVPAAAGVESNIVDFARWMQATMGDRPDVLAQSTLRIAQSPRVNTAPIYGGELRQANSEAHYGLGWRSFKYDGHLLLGHSGAVDGYRATMIFDPASRVGVVAMWNSNWGTPFRIPFAVFDSYHKRTDSRWLELD